MPEHVSGRDIKPRKSRFNATVIALVVTVAAIVVFLVTYNISSILPSSGEQKYEDDGKMIELASMAFSTGYPANPPSGGGYGRDAGVGGSGLGRAGKGYMFGIWPSFAQTYRGTDEALSLEDVHDDEITTLGVFESNPAGGTRGGLPIWEDVDGDGSRDPAMDKLFYGEASRAPQVDHWNTETVVEFDGDRQYVIDSRDWFIDINVLMAKEFLDYLPASASPDNHPEGTGSYSWYVDENGQINSLLYTDPRKKGFQNKYP